MNQIIEQLIDIENRNDEIKLNAKKQKASSDELYRQDIKDIDSEFEKKEKAILDGYREDVKAEFSILHKELDEKTANLIKNLQDSFEKHKVEIENQILSKILG